MDVGVRQGAEKHLVPKGYTSQLPLTPELMGHFRFLAQKWTMRQDSMLLGHPNNLRRHIAFAFAEACGKGRVRETFEGHHGVGRKQRRANHAGRH